ncbi:metallophosphoesterase [Streptomyces sp. NBC_00257]|uniref:metallophosphoesterase n=1 Tax=unclassified Streptomyces TaxID=2593676 RepID=UPI002256119E|nr:MULTISPECIES: metallophosphoesterase [unclassified Streptomyces]WTB59810.1 metallophosphoesterase [Streptomyces sp. NBC_00826]WTH95602.1 metallophosphoesterase [Streptomyces sp. NBC_00825]WTI04332.1 metallophosphoesterase [Streptomyces sp. NBC_00822]MCX4864988.1 metallophosphoesterase [Streptomyces sp. NBC_00906]MCX4896226.1 metallophosphoesterase [Streptomyces sp. NBC_00892]
MVIVVLALLAGVHRYLWCRLVGDTTAEGSAMRRAGTVAAYVLPLLSVGALVSGRAGAPFWLQRVLAWPGYLWLAAVLYLTLALLVGEAVRPVLRRVLARRADRAGRPDDADTASVDGANDTDPASDANNASIANHSNLSVDAPDAPDALDAADAPGAGTSAAPATLVAEAPAPPRPDAPSRRLFVARAVGGAAAVAGLGTVGLGTYGVLRGPRVKRITVPLAKLPRSAHGFRIAVVSDIHLGPILGRAHTRRIVDTINRTQPDLVAVVGDLVDGTVADLGPAAEPLARLKARHGNFFVTGNHEYYSGAAQWVDHVKELGLHPLENDRVEIDGFDLAGVNDIAGESEGQGPDFARALGDRDRTRAAVLLAHQPVVIHDAVAHGVDLQLSGHTHGGQLWPGNFIADLANPTGAGLDRYGDTQLYVSRGAGAWGPPVRVGAPSDITVVELASLRA